MQKVLWSVTKNNFNNSAGHLPLILEDAENYLTPLSREIFAEHYEKLTVLDEEIKRQDQRISRLCNSHALRCPRCRVHDRIHRCL